MAEDGSATSNAHEHAPLEHELTMHLVMADELGERVKRANGAAQQEIARARVIADELTQQVSRRSR